MNLEQADSYVESCLEKGYAKKEITDALKDSGYSEDQVEEIYREVKGRYRTFPVSLKNPFFLGALLIVVFGVLGFGAVQFDMVGAKDTSFYVAITTECNQARNHDAFMACVRDRNVLIDSEESCNRYFADSDVNHVCKSLIRENEEMCKLSGGLDMICLMLHAYQQQDSSLCEAFPNLTIREKCRRAIAEPVYVSTLNRGDLYIIVLEAH
jgi:hypothetical protein